MSGHLGTMYRGGHLGTMYTGGHLGKFYFDGHMGKIYICGHLGKIYIDGHLDKMYIGSWVQCTRTGIRVPNIILLLKRKLQLREFMPIYYLWLLFVGS